jgi:hypothetical protein
MEIILKIGNGLSKQIQSFKIMKRHMMIGYLNQLLIRNNKNNYNIMLLLININYMLKKCIDDIYIFI